MSGSHLPMVFRMRSVNYLNVIPTVLDELLHVTVRVGALRFG
jgi:hypothetical protein